MKPRNNVKLSCKTTNVLVQRETELLFFLVLRRWHFSFIFVAIFISTVTMDTGFVLTYRENNGEIWAIKRKNESKLLLELECHNTRK